MIATLAVIVALYVLASTSLILGLCKAAGSGEAAVAERRKSETLAEMTNRIYERHTSR